MRRGIVFEQYRDGKEKVDRGSLRGDCEARRGDHNHPHC